jgi:hypothetical protein
LPSLLFSFSSVPFALTSDFAIPLAKSLLLPAFNKGYISIQYPLQTDGSKLTTNNNKVKNPRHEWLAKIITLTTTKKKIRRLV